MLLSDNSLTNLAQCCEPGCQEPADGLDDEHCQMHWEAECDRSFAAAAKNLYENDIMPRAHMLPGLILAQVAGWASVHDPKASFSGSLSGESNGQIVLEVSLKQGDLSSLARQVYEVEKLIGLAEGSREEYVEFIDQSRSYMTKTLLEPVG